jgi:hypothetical protein
MIDNRTLDDLVKQFRKPRNELEGMSYEEHRSIKFWGRFSGLKELLTLEKLKNLTAAEAKKLYLNASTGGRKERTLPHFEENPISSIRESFIYLIYGEEEHHKRFTETTGSGGKHKLKGVDLDTISTILHLHDPTKFCVWNKRAIKGIQKLRLDEDWPNRMTSGQRYLRMNSRLQSLASEYNFSDLDVVDEFLCKVYEGKLVLKNLPKPSKKRPEAKVPKRRKVKVTKHDRNRQQVEYVKEAEYHTCQICGIPILIPDDEYYSEAHHIHPLNEGGIDDVDNMLCLCPNHHVEMENGVFYIDPVSRVIIYFNGEQSEYHGCTLDENRNPEYQHIVRPDVLIYHRDKKCKSWIR